MAEEVSPWLSLVSAFHIMEILYLSSFIWSKLSSAVLFLFCFYSSSLAEELASFYHFACCQNDSLPHSCCFLLADSERRIQNTHSVNELPFPMLEQSRDKRAKDQEGEIRFLSVGSMILISPVCRAAEFLHFCALSDSIGVIIHITRAFPCVYWLWWSMKNGRFAGLLVGDKWTQDSGIGCLSFIGLENYQLGSFWLHGWWF